jgi:hypothetical protein
MIATLESFNILVVIFEIFVIAIVVILGVDLVIFEYQEKKKISNTYKSRHSNKEIVRRAKEAVAHEGFFEESYVTRFAANGAVFHQLVMVPTATALAYYDEMDRLADEQIFENTKEL